MQRILTWIGGVFMAYGALGFLSLNFIHSTAFQEMVTLAMCLVGAVLLGSAAIVGELVAIRRALAPPIEERPTARVASSGKV